MTKRQMHLFEKIADGMMRDGVVPDIQKNKGIANLNGWLEVCNDRAPADKAQAPASKGAPDACLWAWATSAERAGQMFGLKRGEYEIEDLGETEIDLRGQRLHRYAIRTLPGGGKKV